MEKNSVTGGRNIMATEAQNIMQAFYSANKREEVKEEEREFKKGALGYMGGVPGALFDIAAGMEAYNTSQALTEGIASITDTRSKEQKILDKYIEERDVIKNLETNLKGLPVYDEIFTAKATNKTISQIATELGEDLGDIIPQLGLSDQVNDITQSVKLTNVTSDGSVINYTVGKFQPGQGMLKRFGQ
jgi:hypothetical protein